MVQILSPKNFLLFEALMIKNNQKAGLNLMIFGENYLRICGEKIMRLQNTG